MVLIFNKLCHFRFVNFGIKSINPSCVKVHTCQERLPPPISGRQAVKDRHFTSFSESLIQFYIILLLKTYIIEN